MAAFWPDVIASSWPGFQRHVFYGTKSMPSLEITHHRKLRFQSSSLLSHNFAIQQYYIVGSTDLNISNDSFKERRVRHVTAIVAVAKIVSPNWRYLHTVTMNISQELKKGCAKKDLKLEILEASKWRPLHRRTFLCPVGCALVPCTQIYFYAVACVNSLCSN